MQRAAAALHLFPSGLRLPRRQGIVLGHQSVAVLAQALGDGVDDVLAQALFAEDTVGSAGQRQLLILTLEGVGRDGDEVEALFADEPAAQVIAPLQEGDIHAGSRSFLLL